MKSGVLAGLAVWAVPVIAVAEQAPRFDLICSGVERPLGEQETKAEQRRYTIDLAAKRWCRTTECKEGLPIESITADELVLTKSKPGAALEHRHSISRVTGKYAETIFVATVSSGSRSEGTCQRAAFSGFPKAMF